MISVNEAKAIINKYVEVLPSIKLSLKDAVGYVLAEDVFSLTDFPPFNQSSVDGYAIAFKDVHDKLIIADEIAAGDNRNVPLQSKHAMRIFTGAAIPANADTVVMQEKVIIKNNELIIQDEKLLQGLNFRPHGKDISKGALALQKEDLLTPGAIGFLAGLGLTEVKVYKKPTISIIITGNELQQSGKPLQYGQVYESNSFALIAALQQFHFNDINTFYVNDKLELITSTLHNSLIKSDAVILCGGISVGDYDFVLQAATDCGVEKLFHTVKQRPGKPLYFGKKENKYVFGLPGNPSSALTCFYEYIIVALEKMTNKNNMIKTMKAALITDYKKIKELTFFLNGFVEEDKVMPLDAQESYRLSSYAKANCLIILEEGRTEYEEGEKVEVHLLP